VIRNRRGVPLVISAPSGGGKTTLCRRLMEELGGIEFSVSHTTRASRGEEVNGVDYHFVGSEQFQKRIDGDEFLEWATVHGNYYGTDLASAQDRLEAGQDVLFDIDIQGGHQIADRLSDAVLIFILPPNMEVLEERLRGRGTDSDEAIAKRLKAAEDEIRSATGYTHWIVNDQLESALGELKSIVVEQRIRRRDRVEVIASVLGG